MWCVQSGINVFNTDIHAKIFISKVFSVAID